MSNLSALADRQPRVAAVLGAALASRRMHHAYLLVGAEAAVARELASAVAAALVCTRPSGGDACGSCPACRKLAGGNHPDVMAVAPSDKGVISIEQIREVSARITLKASESATKVVIISSLDAATPQAQNALLKRLEEPPGDTCFLLTVTRLRSLLPTVRSRCLTLRLAPVDRLAAWRELEKAGVPVPAARALGPLVADAERAQELGGEDFEELLSQLGRAIDPDSDAMQIVAAAADIGASRERADLALALLEVRVRDALARRHGAPSDLLYDDLAGLPSGDLAAAAERLALLRRLTALHLNRTLAVEAVLRDLRRAGVSAP